MNPTARDGKRRYECDECGTAYDGPFVCRECYDKMTNDFCGCHDMHQKTKAEVSRHERALKLAAEDRADRDGICPALADDLSVTTCEVLSGVDRRKAIDCDKNHEQRCSCWYNFYWELSSDAAFGDEKASEGGE